MKKMRFYLLVMLVTMFFLNSCFKECIEPGSLTTEFRTAKDFTGIDAGSAFEVYITQGDTEEVRIESNRGYLSHITTSVSGGVLHIGTDHSVHMCSPHILKAFVTVKSLNKVIASGASTIAGSSDFQAENFDIELRGASEINLSLNVTNTLNCNASGASEATLTGSANTFQVISLSGASDLHAYNFATEKTIIDNSGASDAEVNVSSELSVTASGASVVKYKGSPVIVKMELSGASELIKQ
jgi:hypothetical protein